MSEESREANLKCSEEIAVSESSVNESGKNTKRNYCYVCKVQCTALKNLQQHEKGKKHLKNLDVFQRNQKKELRRNNLKKSSGIDTTSSRSLTSHEDLSASNPDETQDSNFNFAQNTAMNNFNRRPAKNKRYEYFNPDYSNNNSRYHQRNSYSNEYRRGRGNFSNHQSWTNPKYFNTPYRNNDHFSYTQNNSYYSNSKSNYSYENDYFTENKPVLSSHTDFNDDLISSNNKTEDSVHEPESSGYNENFAARGKRYYDVSLSSSGSADNKIADSVCRPESSGYSDENSAHRGRRYYDSSLSSSESARLSKRKIHYDDENPSTSNPPFEKPSGVGASSKSNLEKEPKVDGKARERSFTLSKGEISKLVEKRRVSRSRSLSASESSEGKNQTEHQTDSDGASQEQRIKDWTNALLEPSNNQISRLINPSNYKEKAAVNHLITKLSRTKRKEILTRTMRSSSMECTENNNNEAASDLLKASADILISACDEDTNSVNSGKEQFKQEQNDFTFIDSQSSLIRKNNSKKDLDSVLNVAAASSRIAVEETSPLIESSKKFNRIEDRITDSSMDDSGLTLNVNSPEVRQEKVRAKRKKSESDVISKGKKQKISGSRSGVRKSTESPETGEDTLTVEDFNNSADIPKVLEQNISQTLVDLKQEFVEFADGNQAASAVDTNSPTALGPNLVFNSEFSVESLIQLFASGNVKVKEEFSDPAVDAIKEINPDELMNACSSVGKATNQIPTEPKRSLKDKPVSKAPSSLRQGINMLDPGATGSAENVDVVKNSPLLPNLSSPSSDKPTEQSSSTFSRSEDNSSSKEMNNLNMLNKTKSELPPYLHELIAQLRDISSQEEDVKEKLSDAKSKISKYGALLEEWKNKKRILQMEEDDLRKKRNDIIKSMQSAVDENEQNSEELNTSQKACSSTHQPAASLNPPPAVELNSQVAVSPNKLKPSSSLKSPPVRQRKKKSNKSPSLTESDDITILPIPSKLSPPEIIICDDLEEDIVPAPKSVRNNMVTNVVSKKGPTLNLKSWNAHDTVVNSIMVFEDYLYTCSNDNTAKRFSLKDGSLNVTYVHRLKNVTEIMVEKAQKEAHVFTSCSNKIISIFIASSGTKIKCISSHSAVMSICKGWGMFYCGLANGTINAYDSKCEEREIVKTENPVTRLATAHQGRLHVLVILSSEGRISIRDAVTGLLIRCCLIQIRHPSWMTLSNDLVYLSTADKELIILDIMSGRVEKQIHLNNHSTGLAVCDDYVFTIAYNGVIHCLNKDKMCDKKLFYGAGQNSLTCIHVYNDWVFTGNRKGEVSLFHFDPLNEVTCKFHSCNLVYGFREDLAHHIEKDHLSKRKCVSTCQWHRCHFTFPASSDTTDKMNHYKSHIYEMHSL